ncbi:IS66 family insertion sequence element accessory protein TnpA [Algoriphagus persicinus]|uniref:IS66 family insertion sequence element accessory protein TnpA n=1 Tax=Algoriphagus persicinus TaxID=3108754 RepID=UPI002B3DC26F|nr:hypothetical protein [Algoriphagus sp. E1-3-M2]MEB2787375.1 hypothetical protein [Algoriphagus sp. E1-3-M2]
MKKTSNEAYYSLYCKWQESGKSKTAFATSVGIPKATFYYWCKKFDTDSVTTASPFSIIPMDHITASPVARISYPSGISVELFGVVDVVTVRELVG